MNANDIRNRASSFFERLKVYAAFTVRYIVFICRKYPLIAAVFLLFYAFFLYRFLSPNFSIGSNNKNLPIPTQQQTPMNSQTTTSNTNTSTSNSSNLPSTADSPVVEPAQATAIRSDNDLSIRWSKPIEDPLIYSEKELLDSSCLSRRCNITLSEPISQVEVYWKQEGKRFVKNFQLAGATASSNFASEEELKEQAVANLEQKHKQLKQKRLKATQAVFEKGKVFEGTISSKKESQPVKIEISEIVGSSYIVVISNPIKETTQIFEGEVTEVFKGRDFGIRVDYSPEKSSAFLFLKSRSPQSDLPEDAWRFYKEEVILLLAPTDLGVDGVAESTNSNYGSGWDYKVVLRQ